MVPESVACRRGERGIASLLALVGMAVVLLMLIAGLSIVEISAKSIVGQLRYQGQAANVARAGTTNALVWFQAQLSHLRRAEANPHNYRAAAAGFLAEVDRMQRDVREYLSLHPSELAAVA